MAKQLELRRGTTQANNLFTGAAGEVTMDTDTKQLRVHDGVKTGGYVVDTLVAFQVPTAENNYTWYRKYASGWVEQGGVENTLTTTTRDVILPVVMADGNYTVTIGQYVDNATGQYVYIRNAPETTKLVIKTNSGTIAKAYWCVSGMAA